MVRCNLCGLEIKKEEFLVIRNSRWKIMETGVKIAESFEPIFYYHKSCFNHKIKPLHKIKDPYEINS